MSLPVQRAAFQWAARKSAGRIAIVVSCEANCREKQFPYTPNVRGVRTDEWKYIRYPHGDGKPDRHKAELYYLKDDPEESRNLICDAKQAGKVKELQEELARLMKEAGLEKDEMPLDEGIKKELPDLKIR